MKIAIYGRYSTYMQREASIEDQYRNCRKFAEKEGWPLNGNVTYYEDKGISGAVTDRPGYQKMLKEGEQKKFNLLLLDDLSRLSRDDIEMKTAGKLNTLKVQSPRKGLWAASAIYGGAGDGRSGVGILNNPLYIGRYIWNRSKWIKDPDRGQRKRVERPESEWIIQEMPELRIVPQELWERVKERQRDQYRKSAVLRASLKNSRVRTGRGPKYLFSSLLECGRCGGNYVVIGSTSYGCSSHRDKGGVACDNKLTVRRTLVEERLLESIKSELSYSKGSVQGC